MEKFRGVGLVEHCKELYPPRIATLFAGPVDEDRDTLVDVFCKVRVAFEPEDGTGPGIEIEELEVAGGQGNVPFLVSKVIHCMGEEYEVRGFALIIRAAKKQYGKLISAINIRENLLSVFKVIQTAQSL